MSETAPATIPHWIDGSTVRGGAGVLPVFNPSLGRIVRELKRAGRSEVAAAVASAERAFPGWSRTTPLKRARILFRYREILAANAERLAALIAEEHGKTRADARAEVARGIEVIEFACGAPHLLKGEFSADAGGGVDNFGMREPLGVVAGVTPFNFPVMVPLWMFPLALAAGNTFVLKPSERDPSAALLLAQLLTDAGAPPGVLNVIQGDRLAVEALIEHPRIAAVSLVGSTPVAREVYLRATRTGKRVQALGGAKNHLVVMPDADLEAAAQALIGAAYGSAGERCMAVSVAVAVGDEVAERLIELMTRRISRLRIGRSDEEGVEMGPLVTDAHRTRVREYIECGVAEAARLAVDGRSHPCVGLPGFFLGPSLFDHVRPHMRIYREEIFGPVLGLVRVASYRDAIDLINAHALANGAALFTQSGATAREFIADAAVGMVGVNVPVPVPMAFHSFGGWRASLHGDHHMYGMEGLRFYTHLKTVSQSWPRSAPTEPAFAMPAPE
ncbi:MAG TPA: CoA-acylating methylmalonate-semialdehyde dehydrogenase [Steroidobacteraceae bacterium]|nr:CoA-acylating methylmalonate-semialdehyde dehydrogenase [Steroidobacteraceae bacterium]